MNTHGRDSNGAEEIDHSTPARAFDLRLGDYREVLADTWCHAVITDPPYSERTHEGQSDKRREISYEHWSAIDVGQFCRWAVNACDGWIVVQTDHALAPHFCRRLDDLGRYVFAPLPFVAPGSRVRLAGDGPSCWTVWIVVARPRSARYSKWGTLPGAYVLPPGQSERNKHIGGKPTWIMRELVRHYSRPGDVVCDPCAGYATTGVACMAEGRRFIGAEVDPETHATATKRLKAGHTAPLFPE